MVRAALYIRVSTEEQALHGLSIEAQTEALDAWAKANGVRVADHYIDAGISARKSAAKRPELQRLLRDVEAGWFNKFMYSCENSSIRYERSCFSCTKIQEARRRGAAGLPAITQP